MSDFSSFTLSEISFNSNLQDADSNNKDWQLSDFKNQRRKYEDLKLMLNLTEKYTEDDSALEDKLKYKINQVLMNEKVDAVLSIDSKSTDATTSNLLGLCLDNDIKVNYFEGNDLSKALESQMKNKLNTLREEFKIATGIEVDSEGRHHLQSTPFQLTTQDKLMFDLGMDLHTKRNAYIQLLLDKQDILEKFLQLRLENLPNFAQDKLMASAVNAKMNELRSRILDEKSRVEMFTENGETSLAAYNEVFKDVEEQICGCKIDILKLENLKEQYQKVNSKQYNELLKTYKEYKFFLEKMHRMRDCLI